MFWLRFLRLVLSVAAEGIYNAFWLLLFPFRRRQIRERVRACLYGTGRKPALVLVVVANALLVGGCSAFPGASFENGLAQTEWSVHALVGMPGWRESLGEDLEMLADPEWDQLADTFSQLGW